MAIESATHRMTLQNQSVRSESKHTWTVFSQDMVMLLIPIPMSVFGGEGGGSSTGASWVSNDSTQLEHYLPGEQVRSHSLKTQSHRTPFLAFPSPTAHF